MPTEVGSAISRYSLDISGLRQGITDAKKLLNDFRQEVAKEYTANIRINARIVGENAIQSAKAAAQAAPTVLTGSAATAAQQNAVKAARDQTDALDDAAKATDAKARADVRAAIAAKDYATAVDILTRELARFEQEGRDATQIQIALAAATTRLTAQTTQTAVNTAEQARAQGNYVKAVNELEKVLKTLSTTSAEYFIIQRALRQTAKEAADAGAIESSTRARNLAGIQGAIRGIDDETKARVRAAVQAKDYASALTILEAAHKHYVATGRDVRDVEQAQALLRERLAKQTTQTAIAEAKMTAETGDLVGAMLQLNNAFKGVTNESDEYITLSKEILKISQQATAESVKRATILAAEAAKAGELSKALSIMDNAMEDLDKTSNEYNTALRVRERLVREAQEASEKLADTYTRELSNARKLTEAYNNNRAQRAALGPASAPGFDKQRAADLDAEAATLTTRISDAQDRLFRSTIRLIGSMGEYQDAINILETALEGLEEGTTAWNNLQALTNDLYKRMTRESQATADSLIREAKARGDNTEAIRLYRVELDKAGNSAKRTADLNAGLSKTLAAQPSLLNAMTGALNRWLVPMASGAFTVLSFDAALRQLIDAFKLIAQLDQQRRAIGAMVQNVERGNLVFQQAIEFGQRYAFTQREMGEAAADAAILLQQSNVSATQTFEVLARLQARAPSKTFNDAVRSVAELQAGQLQSIERVFNIPQRYAQRLKEEIDKGADPILALDQLLTQLGVTAESLQQRLEGPGGSINRLATATERFKVELGNLVGAPAAAFVNFLAGSTSGINKLINGLRGVVQLSPREFLRAWGNGLKDFAQGMFDVRNVVLGVFNPLTTVYRFQGSLLSHLGAAGKAAADKQAAAAEAAKAAQFDYNKELARTIALQKERQGLAESAQADSSASQLNTQLNVAVNRFAAGTDNAVKFYETLLRINNEAKRPIQSALVDEINKLGLEGTEKVQAFENAILHLQNEVLPKAVTFEQKQQVSRDILALAQQLAMLEAMSPVEITVDLQVKGMANVTSALNSMRNQAQQFADDVARINEDYAENIAQSNAESLAADMDYGRRRVAAEKQFAAELQAERDAYGRQRAVSAGQFLMGQIQAEREFGRERAAAAREFGQEMARAEQEFGAERVRAARQFGQQLARMERDYAQQRDRAIRDFGQQMARAERDFNQSLSRAARDFAQGRDRAIRDYNRQEARTQEEFDRQQHQTTEQAQRQEARDLREHLRNLQRMQRDYDRGRLRDTQDFELERAVLLAEGRIAEAQVLASRFAVDQRRKAEDFATSRGDAGDEFARSGEERTQQLEEQLREQQEAFERARRQRQEDFALQLADAQAAYDQQVADQRAAYEQMREDSAAAFAQQQDDAKKAFDQSVEDAKAAYAEQEAEAQAAYARQVLEATKSFAKQEAIAQASFETQQEQREKDYRRQQADADAAFAEQQEAAQDNFDAQAEIERKAHWEEQQKRAFRRVEMWRERQADYAARTKQLQDHYDEQKRILDQAAIDAKRVEELVVASGGAMDRKMAEAVVAMQRATEEYEKVLAKQMELAAQGGKATAAIYILEMAKELEKRAKEDIPPALGPAADYLLPRSPIKAGPLKDHERGAKRAADMYVRAFAQGLVENQSLVAEAMRPYAAMLGTSAPDLRGMSASASNTVSSRPIQISMSMGSVVMDGRVVGQIVAPHIAEVLSDELDVSANVMDAVYTPGVKQQAFRSP